MTIDEAIIHAEEVANEKERLGAMGRGTPDKYAPSPEQCFKCAKDHRQLAEWLKELKTLREQRPHGEWIFKNGKYRCTACGEKAIYLTFGMSNIPKEILTDFCYNCGADMREEGE